MAVSGSAVYPALHHAPVTTQYHSQDEHGQYAYGYSGGPSAKHEQRTADGVTRGGYSYVDANGLVQSLSYVSDPANGFRVAGTNLPVDTNTASHAVPVVHHAAPAPVLAAAQPAIVDARHLAVNSYVAPAPAYSYAAAPAPAHIVSVKHTEYAAPPAPIVSHVAAPYAVTAHAASVPVATSYTSVVRHDSAPVVSHYAAAPAPVLKEYAVPAPVFKQYAAPAPVVLSAPVEVPHVYAAAPVAHVAVAPAKSQYHSQDEHGQYTYGYTDGSSAKTETRYADGETKGSYSYVDDHGAVQAVHYSAGAEGFKAAGTNIPVHHVWSVTHALIE